MKAIRWRRSATMEGGTSSDAGRPRCLRALIPVLLVLIAGLAGLRSRGSGRALAESDTSTRAGRSDDVITMGAEMRGRP